MSERWPAHQIVLASANWPALPGWTPKPSDGDAGRSRPVLPTSPTIANDAKVQGHRPPKKRPGARSADPGARGTHTAGDPMTAQKWLNCRLCDIRQTLDQHGHRVSKPVISRILRAHGYSLRANVKQAAGAEHPDRDQQFGYIQLQR